MLILDARHEGKPTKLKRSTCMGGVDQSVQETDYANGISFLLRRNTNSQARSEKTYGFSYPYQTHEDQNKRYPKKRNQGSTASRGCRN